MSEDPTEAITTQPKGMKRTEVRDYVRQLDASTVLGESTIRATESLKAPTFCGAEGVEAFYSVVCARSYVRAQYRVHGCTARGARG